MPDACFALSDGTQVCPSAPFFITGSGRCGTTLLRRLILNRAQAAIPPENYTLGLSRRGMDMARGDWPAFCGLILHGVRTYVSDWRDFVINENEALVLLTTIPPPFRTIANFWHGFHALYARGLGKPPETRWGDKTPTNVGRLDEIRHIFPAARFVFMVRDVFDTTYSFGRMTAAGRLGNYAGGALRWADANAKILSFTEAHRPETMIVRYEDLVASPDQVVQVVLRFLDLPPSDAGAPAPREVHDMASQPHLRHALDDVGRDRVGKGRCNLPDEVRQQIALLAAPLQVRLGYEPTGSHRFPLIDLPIPPATL